MTLEEHDRLLKDDPERYWELYCWLREKNLREKKKIDDLEAKLEAKSKGYSGEKSVGSADGLNANIRKKEDDDDFYSIIIKGDKKKE